MTTEHTFKEIETQGDRARWVCKCGSRGIFVGGLFHTSASERARDAFRYHADSAWNTDGSARDEKA